MDQIWPVLSQKVYIKPEVRSHVLIARHIEGLTYLPLGREVAVTGGDAEQEAVILEELLGVLEHGHVGGLGGGVHLVEDILGQGLGDLEEVGGAAGLFNASLFSISELLDVAVHRVLRAC